MTEDRELTGSPIVASPTTLQARVESSDASRDPDFGQTLVQAIPGLRAFAMSLCGQADTADDLAQQTLLKAWDHQSSFVPGTNMRAWLFTILRNEFYGHLRISRREVPDIDGVRAAQMPTPGSQESNLEMADLRLALGRLPPEQREAVILIGASGFSYQEASEICGAAVGTIKSRVNRAREKLGRMLNIPPPPLE